MLEHAAEILSQNICKLLKQCGIETEIINMLQGRIGKDIFLRHYMTPNSNFKNDVLAAVEQLQEQLKV